MDQDQAVGLTGRRVRMRIGSMAIVAFNHRADFLFEKGIDIAKDGVEVEVEVEVARRINIDNTAICKHYLA